MFFIYTVSQFQNSHNRRWHLFLILSPTFPIYIISRRNMWFSIVIKGILLGTVSRWTTKIITYGWRADKMMDEVWIQCHFYSGAFLIDVTVIHWLTQHLYWPLDFWIPCCWYRLKVVHLWVVWVRTGSFGHVETGLCYESERKTAVFPGRSNLYNRQSH